MRPRFAPIAALLTFAAVSGSAPTAVAQVPPGFVLTDGGHPEWPPAISDDGLKILVRRQGCESGSSLDTNALDRIDLSAPLGYQGGLRAAVLQDEPTPVAGDLRGYAVAGDACRVARVVPNPSNGTLDTLETSTSCSARVTFDSYLGDVRPDCLSMTRNGDFTFVRGHDGVGINLLRRYPTPTPTGPAGDIDGDTVADASDNCEAVANASQIDTDRDGIGDACEGLLIQNGGSVTDRLLTGLSESPPDRWFSDDGKRAVYTFAVATIPSAVGAEIATMPAAGGVLRLSIAGAVETAAMSADGSRIALIASGQITIAGITYGASGSLCLYRIDLGGTTDQMPTIARCDVVALAQFGWDLGGLSLSADGSRAFWASRASWDGVQRDSQDLFMIDLGGGSARALTDLPAGLDAWNPRCDHDGRHVVFTRIPTSSLDGGETVLLSPDDAPEVPIAHRGDPDFPHELLGLIAAGSGANFSGSGRVVESLGTGPGGTKLLLHGRATAPGAPEFPLGWRVQDFRGGAPSEITSRVTMPRSGADTYVLRIVGQGEQLDARESRTVIQ